MANDARDLVWVLLFYQSVCNLFRDMSNIKNCHRRCIKSTTRDAVVVFTPNRVTYDELAVVIRSPSFLPAISWAVSYVGGVCLPVIFALHSAVVALAMVVPIMAMCAGVTNVLIDVHPIVRVEISTGETT